jgi:hypothetical protein
LGLDGCFGDGADGLQSFLLVCFVLVLIKLSKHLRNTGFLSLDIDRGLVANGVNGLFPLLEYCYFSAVLGCGEAINRAC